MMHEKSKSERRRSVLHGGWVMAAMSLLIAPGCIFFDDGTGSTGGDNASSGQDMTTMADMENLADMSDAGGGGDLYDDPCRGLTCAAGSVCEAGTCVCSEATCSSLGEGFACVGRECIKLDCTEDQQCGPGQVCTEGVCEEIGCDSDDACPDRMVCEQGQCVMACVNDSECPGHHNVCEQGHCVDLLTDSRHCGEVGKVCSDRRACQDGLCVCGDLQVESNAKGVSIFFGGNYKTWPEPQLVAFPTLEHYICSQSSVSVEKCEESGGQVLYNEDYPLTSEHFVAVAVKEGQDEDSLVFRALDGRGNTVGSDLELLVGNEEKQERIVNYRLARVGWDRYFLFVQWRKDGQDLIYGYVLNQGPTSMGIQPITSESGRVIVFKDGANITDFSVLPLLNETGVFVAMSMTSMKGSKLEDGGQLHFHLFGFDSALRLTADIAAVPYELKEMRQFSEGMNMVVRPVNNGGVRAHVLAFDSEPHGMEAAAPRIGHITAYSNLFTFEMTPDKTQFSLLEEQIKTMGVTYVSELDVLNSYLFGDRSVMPAAPYLFWDANAMVMQRLGWDFYAGRGMSLRTSVRFTAVGGGSEVSTSLYDTLDDLRVFDGVVVAEGQDDIYVHHVEQVSSSSGRPSRVIVYGLAKNASTGKDEYTIGKPLTPSLRYRRVSSVPGPHATGVLATSLAQNVGAELYFVVNGNEAVCH